jgi:hypothetical protein
MVTSASRSTIACEDEFFVLRARTEQQGIKGGSSGRADGKENSGKRGQDVDDEGEDEINSDEDSENEAEASRKDKAEASDEDQDEPMASDEVVEASDEDKDKGEDVVEVEVEDEDDNDNDEMDVEVNENDETKAVAKAEENMEVEIGNGGSINKSVPVQVAWKAATAMPKATAVSPILQLSTCTHLYKIRQISGLRKPKRAA